MKSLFSFLAVVLVTVALGVVAFAADADPAAVAAAATPEGVSTTTWIAAILGVLLAVSELLALIPGVRTNGIFDAIYRGLKALGRKDVK